MTKKLQFIKNKKAVTSAYETIGAMAIILVVVSVFFASINGIFMPYNGNIHNQLDTGIKATETIIKDTGQNQNFEGNWEDDSSPEDTLSVLGLGKEPTLVEYEETGEGEYELIYASTQFIIELGLRPIGGEAPTCFLAGTQIKMADNTYKNIEDVKLGDMVEAYNEQTGENVDSQVVHVFHHTPEEMTDHYLTINNYLKVTPNHKLFIANEWRKAKDIKIGDLLGADENTYEIYSIEKIFEKVPTYNFEVEKHHNYFVQTSDDSTLVHNRAAQKVWISGFWVYNSETGQWDFHRRAGGHPRYYKIREFLEEDPKIPSNYSYNGNVFTESTDFESILQHYEMLGISSETYGFVDKDKIDLLSSMPYEKAKEALGLSQSQNMRLEIIDSSTGEKLLDYGDEISEGDIQTIFNRNIVVFPSIPAKLKITVS